MVPLTTLTALLTYDIIYNFYVTIIPSETQPGDGANMERRPKATVYLMLRD